MQTRRPIPESRVSPDDRVRAKPLPSLKRSYSRYSAVGRAGSASGAAESRRPTTSSAVLVRTANRLLSSLQSGSMSETAYDTAWVARVRDPRDPTRQAFPTAIDWLVRHQRADGSWGGQLPVMHDRVVSTLAAVLALAESPSSQTARAVNRGATYLAESLPRIDHEAVETVGFELIMPPLLARARSLGLPLPHAAAPSIDRLRADKLQRLPPGIAYLGLTSLTHSLEFLGEDLQPDVARQCRASNGSYGASPSATAYVLTHQWDEAAAAYLRAVLALSTDGGVSNVYPFEIFERAWVLYSLGPLARRVAAHRPVLAQLAAAWSPAGVGFTREGVGPDGDDTAITFRVLHNYGLLSSSPEVLRLFEADDHFFCFPLERNPSVSTNAHILDALNAVEEYKDRGCLVNKALQFLASSRIDDRYWRDKWHVSPYYATSQTLQALYWLGQEAEYLSAPAVAWLLETQHSNGSWSELEAGGTCEETAHALRALCCLRRPEDVHLDAMRRAVRYLWERFDRQDYPELWVGKGLYTPRAVVRAAILGALDASERTLVGDHRELHA
jgi:halimadienyl-diphosphate synthase